MHGLSRQVDLTTSRYALLRTYRRDGSPVDTPIWLAAHNGALVFRTKVGPKTKRLTTRPDVELTPCDYRGEIQGGATTFVGRATLLSGVEAQEANRALHRRYGWQWNVVPLVSIPGVTHVHRGLPLREKLRRARATDVWPDSVIVRIELDGSR
ncbi:PPOX class F420-dependent oxidoreductase [Mycobacterium sp. OTB74]|jgi:PPOX class probable F420-dependent enzyme|uniref:PPOX class F420-dependent oxidoreductase n=1 Tax=Mycobacterium sp. OTB74 TaxID=1853452 RepID=UPI002476776C|nr:PPOX class F420-dependent oxidoreductase [Mycobacterium sp. OTB74]MDH6243322.1 PPOX class probable F420-dependent enzyme [Mycobacterium sp. OTB74]